MYPICLRYKFGNYTRSQSRIGDRLAMLDESGRLNEADINTALHQILPMFV